MDLVVGRSPATAVKGNTVCIFNHDYNAQDPELKDIDILAVFFKHGHKTSDVLDKLGHPVQMRVFGWVDQTPGEVTSVIASWLTPSIRISPDDNLGLKENIANQNSKRKRPNRQSPKPVDE